MRFWGEIVSPSRHASPIKTIENLWTSGLPTFDDAAEANAFFQALMGLWNNVARFQGGSPPLKLRLGLRLPESSRRRNGNWKLASRDWRSQHSDPGPKISKFPSRDSGALA